MLVLSRKPGQSILIDEKITVTLIGKNKGKYQLGIEVPDGMNVRRSELDYKPRTRTIANVWTCGPQPGCDTLWLTAFGTWSPDPAESADYPSLEAATAAGIALGVKFGVSTCETPFEEDQP